MKKILYFAAAATMMVSCAQNEKLSNELLANQEPTVIGFNTIAEKSTRATVETLETYHQTFAVWSTKKNNFTNSVEVVFCGDSVQDLITYQSIMSPNNWTYSPYRYWDKQAIYDFVAVAPNANIITYSKPGDVADNAGTYVTTDSTGYKLKGQNLQSSTAPATAEKKVGFTGGENGDTDIMTAKKVNRDGNQRITQDVSFEFKHILAKLNIAIAKDPTFDNVSVLIKSVEVRGLDDNGTYVEKSSTTNSGWASSLKDTVNYKLSWANSNGIELLKGEGEGENYQPGKFLYFIESLVMPQSIERNVEKLTINYTIVSGTHEENYTYVLKLDDGQYKVFENFMERNNYTIFLTVRPNVITFDANTVVWDDKNAEGSIVPTQQ